MVDRYFGARDRVDYMARRLQPVRDYDQERIVIVDHQDAHQSVERRAAFGFHGCAGSSNSTTVPWPRPGLSTRIVPPCCSMKVWQIGRPRPTPDAASLVVK